MKLVLIAAVARNGVIGFQGKIPWHISEDLQRFKKLTWGHPVIMGRKTWESLGKPLPGRRNMVLSQRKLAGAKVYSSLEEALREVENEEFVYVIGGQQVYAAALPRAALLEITEVDLTPEGDAFFPELDREEWQEVFREKHEGYAFVRYERKK